MGTDCSDVRVSAAAKFSVAVTKSLCETWSKAEERGQDNRDEGREHGEVEEDWREARWFRLGICGIELDFIWEEANITPATSEVEVTQTQSFVVERMHQKMPSLAILPSTNTNDHHHLPSLRRCWFHVDQRNGRISTRGSSRHQPHHEDGSSALVFKYFFFAGF